MALTLGTVITAARDRHPAFTKNRVPDAVLARELTGFQRRIISKAADLDSNFVAQQCSIIFATSPGNAPNAVQAGSGGGLPADESQPNVVAVAFQDTGPLVELDSDAALVLFSDTVITSVTTTTLTKTGAGWAVNVFANKWVLILTGPAKATLRQILSNTATVLTISTGSDGQQWNPLPVGGADLFRIVDSIVTVDGGVDVVTEITPTETRRGFLVKLDAQGRPFIDAAVPIVATFDRGVFLPPYERVIGGTVRHMADTLISKLVIRPYRMRFQYGPDYTVWLENGQMFLCGAIQDWQNASQIDLRYVPNAPDFTRTTDLFLLDDDAYDMLVWRAAYIAAQRVNAMPDVERIDVAFMKTELDDAQENFMSSVGAHNRAYPVYVKDAW